MAKWKIEFKNYTGGKMDFICDAATESEALLKLRKNYKDLRFYVKEIIMIEKVGNDNE